MAGLSDKAIKTKYTENKYRYDQGNELNSKEFSDGSGLEMYETQYRGLDPQLGRFAQIDPLADKFHFFSTYQYGINNPIYFNDPSGALTQNEWDAALSQANSIFNNPNIKNANIELVSGGQLDYGTTADVSINGTGGTGSGGGGVGYGGEAYSPSDLTGYSAVFDASLNVIGYQKDLPAVVVTPNSNSNWLANSKDALNAVLGGLELLAVIGTDGLLAPVLGLDGSTRILNSINRIATREIVGYKAAKAMPTNLLGNVGAYFYGTGSQAQKNLQNINDILTALTTGGIIGDVSEGMKFFQAGNFLKGLESTTNVVGGIVGEHDAISDFFSDN